MYVLDRQVLDRGGPSHVRAFLHAVLSIMIPDFPAIGSGGVPPVPPTILMSALVVILYFSY